MTLGLHQMTDSTIPAGELDADVERVAKAIYAANPNYGMERQLNTAGGSSQVRVDDPWEDAPDRHEMCRAEARAAISAYLAASPSTPHGYKLAPVEATPEMVRAGMDELGWWTEPRAPEYEQGGLIAEGLTEEEATEINDQLIVAFKEMYAATIASAPMQTQEKR